MKQEPIGNLLIRRAIMISERVQTIAIMIVFIIAIIALVKAFLKGE